MLRLIKRFELTENPRADILSGLTVALALAPEAIAFAFVAGVAPLTGLYAAFFMGLITSIFGGRSGMISGATGATAVAMVALVRIYGVEYLFAAVALSGLLQIAAGVFRVGKFIRLVPHSVMLGFVNGLAAVIFLAQLGQFKNAGAPAAEGLDLGALNILFSGGWLEGDSLYMMTGLTLLTMALITLIPKIPKIGKLIPGSLAGILIVSALVIGLGLETRTVGDMASVSGGLPQFHIPTVPMNWETLRIIFPVSITLAAIGLIESLLTLTLIDEMTDTRGGVSHECVGQGLANTVCGFFGAMGGCAMIGQSMINIKSGGRGRLSGVVAATALLAFILFGSQWIEMIPLAALTGLMMIVVISTFAWASVRILHKIPIEDAFVIVLVTLITILYDLALAVVIGVIVAALVYAWKSARHLYVTEGYSESGAKIYKLHGPLFFGSIAAFRELFDLKKNAHDHEIVIDFEDSRVWDHSALEAVDALTEKYRLAGKKLQLVHLSPDCKLLLKKARDAVKINVIEDPHYRIVTNYSREDEKA